jgi:hypothetical protein
MEDRNTNPSLNSGKTLGQEDVELTRGYTGSTAREGPGRTPSRGIISRDGETYFGAYISLRVLCSCIRGTETAIAISAEPRPLEL